MESSSPTPGVGHFLHTYETDGNPLPTFRGEPERVFLRDSVRELAYDIWENLDENTRQLLTECAKEACNWGRDALEAEEAEILERFEAKGMTITYLTDEQKAAFAEAIADWKAGMIDRFGEDACAAFGITK